MDEVVRIDKKMNAFDERLRCVECAIVENNVLAKQSIEMMKSYNETNIATKEAMIDVSISMTALTRKVSDLGNDMNEMKNKSETKEKEVDEKIKKIENKGKIDLNEIFNKAVQGILISAITALIIYGFSLIK